MEGLAREFSKRLDESSDDNYERINPTIVQKLNGPATEVTAPLAQHPRLLSVCEVDL